MNNGSVAFDHEADNGLENEQLPVYAPMLAAFHRACAPELRQIIDSLPLLEGSHVVDLACGDGVYLPWLAEQVGPSGHVTGVDLSPAYLRLARDHVAQTAYATQITLEQADVYRLPYADHTFDAVWCAHSLYSLPDPLAALREMQRIIKPAGLVMLLENDTLHHYLLPWPPELELAVRQAQLHHLQQTNLNSGRFYIGRNLCAVFDTVGLEGCHITTRTINHHAPLSADERIFLADYLHDLGQRARPFLDAETQKAFDLLIQPESQLYLLDQPNFFATHLEIVAWGRKPS